MMQLEDQDDVDIIPNDNVITNQFSSYFVEVDFGGGVCRNSLVD